MTAISESFIGSIDGQPARRIDRVSAFGAVIALVGCFLMPFVEYRANRIVSGDPFPLAEAGAFGWLLAVVCAFALLASFLPVERHRGQAILIAGVGILTLLPWALGSAATSLQTDPESFARVSIAAGAWSVFAGGAIVWFAGSKSTGSLASRSIAALVAIGGFAAAVLWGGVSELSLAKEYAVQSERFWQLVGEHLILSGSGLGFGALIGIPLGIVSSRNRVLRDVTLGFVGIIQTIPSLALLGLLVIPLATLGLPGIGALPAIIALTFYALLPITRNTYVGLSGVDESAIDAGRGMGMGRMHLLLKVEAPLALPLVLEGLRAAAVMVIGIAAVTAFVGAGGLGILVFQGWGQQADDLTMLGAIPMVILAVLADTGIRTISRLTVSPGIRESS